MHTQHSPAEHADAPTPAALGRLCTRRAGRKRAVEQKCRHRRPPQHVQIPLKSLAHRQSSTVYRQNSRRLLFPAVGPSGPHLSIVYGVQPKWQPGEPHTRATTSRQLARCSPRCPIVRAMRTGPAWTRSRTPAKMTRTWPPPGRCAGLLGRGFEMGWTSRGRKTGPRGARHRPRPTSLAMGPFQ